MQSFIILSIILKLHVVSSPLFLHKSLVFWSLMKALVSYSGIKHHNFFNNTKHHVQDYEKAWQRVGR